MLLGVHTKAVGFCLFSIRNPDLLDLSGKPDARSVQLIGALVDMETGAIVGVTVQGADQGDTTTIAETLTAAAEDLEGRCCMNTRCGWGGVARTSLDPPQEPHYGDAVEGSSHV